MRSFRHCCLRIGTALTLAILAGCGLRTPPPDGAELPPLAPMTPSAPRAPLPRTLGAGAEKVTARPAVPKQVLALYYPWYRTPNHSNEWAHQEGVDTAHKRILSHAHYPVSGPYDSSDDG